MKFEVNTQNDNLSKSFFSALLTLVIFSILIILCNISIKFGQISRHYEINYLCNLLILEKSSLNFKKLSNLTTINSKQKIWDLCREIVK